MRFLSDGLGGYLTIMLAGFLATEVWRWLGRAVATALVSGLVTRMLVFPTGALTEVPLALRLGAFAGGVSLYLLLRRNVAAGVGAAALLLMAGQLVAR
jgi:hypothetical protein